jgi:hypothetical protein
MLAKRQDLRVEIRIEPVGLGDGGLQVVNHQRLGRAAEVLEGVLQATQEVVGRLAIDRLAVRLPRVAQHDPEQMGPSPLAFRCDHRRGGAKVNLGLGAGLTLHPSEWQRRGLLESPTEALDAVVAAAEATLGLQILPDALIG